MLSKMVCKMYGYSTLCRQTIGLQFVVKYTFKSIRLYSNMYFSVFVIVRIQQ